MSVQADTALDGRIRLDEETSKTIDNPPSDIEDQLEAVEFERKSANVFVKKRQPYSSEKQKKVVEVRIEDDSLTLSSESIVGVVNLTPTSKVQIDPKIGWSEILEMFLTVQEQNRSIEYQGVPIREFLGDDLNIEDIFVVIAVNYLNSLEPIWRERLVRTFENQEYDALTGRGRLDIQQSLLNRTHPKNNHLQHFVEKQVKHDIPVHRLLHRAGVELLKLFKLHSGDYHHEGYFRVFESVESQIQRLEERGVSSSTAEYGLYREISVNDLPPARHYYKDALRTSKMILSSSTGQPMAVAEQDLTMDYILNMNDLFEKYTQIVLEQEIENIKSKPRYTGPESLKISANQTIQVFEDETTLNYQPDHVLHTSESPVAVLDSKYYGGEKGPLRDTYARSRLFSYAYFLEVSELAYLVPSGGTESHPIVDKEGSLTVIAPDEFEVSAYSEAVREYFQDLLSEHIERDPLETDLERGIFPVPDVQCTAFSDVPGTEALRPTNVKKKSHRIIRNIADRYSDEVTHSRNVNWRKFSRDFSKMFNHHDGNDYAVPIFIPSSDKEPDRLLIHFLELTEKEEIKEAVICGPYEVNWKEKGVPPLERFEKGDKKDSQEGN
jgi:hypothetical protein